jgi:hypothetical protein
MKHKHFAAPAIQFHALLVSFEHFAEKKEMATGPDRVQQIGLLAKCTRQSLGRVKVNGARTAGQQAVTTRVQRVAPVCR